MGWVGAGSAVEQIESWLWGGGKEEEKKREQCNKERASVINGGETRPG